MTGTVLFSTKNSAGVLCEDGAVRLCSIKGKRIKSLVDSYNGLAVGDLVDVVSVDADKGLISKLHARRNSFGRYNEKGRAEQAIAVNIDRVFCVSSPRLPPFRPRFIDRLAVLAEWAQVPFVIVLNKIDLGLSAETRGRLDDYAALGYRVVEASAKTKKGIEELRSLLEGSLSVFAGQSGVGKSSLLNALSPDLERKTGEVSEKFNRGKHTTTMAEMIFAGPALKIVDTPGIRRLALRSLPVEDLSGCFPEIRLHAENCAFGARCTHKDEQDCAVREAAEQSLMHPDRYESYLRIRQELEQPPLWKKPGVRDPGRRERGLPSRPRSKLKGLDVDDLDEEENLF